MRISQSGTSYNDTIFWDTITGDSGNNMIQITWGNDTVHAGEGADVIWDLDGERFGEFPGSHGTHIWAASDDIINGGGGDDLIFAGLGSDTMNGGTGWDEVDYGYSDAAIYVNLGTGKGSGSWGSYSAGDTLISIEEVHGSKYNDTLKGGDAEAYLHGNDGDDILHGGSALTQMFGGEGKDTFLIGSWLNRAYGGNGVDSVSFYKLSRGVSISGLPISYSRQVFEPSEAVAIGARAFIGHDSIENIIGTRHNDYINYEFSSHDVDNNVFQVYEGNDVVYAYDGNDVVMGGSGNDRLHGGDDSDILQGEAGIDKLYGDSGNDQLFGGAETDYLNGGWGSDRLTGGSGADFFIFGDDALTAAWADVFNMDTITDFVRGSDKIDLAQIDARRDLFGNQAFIFTVGDGIGTVNSFISNGQTFVEAHLNGDGIADIYFRLFGQMTLTAADFIL